MESGNSGSMQSSSGNDDQEFDSSSISRAHETNNTNISSFMNPSSHYPFLTQQNPTTTFFDPQNLDHHQSFQQSNPSYPNSNNNNDLIWSRGLRSDQQTNYANFGNLTPSSSAHVQQQAPYPSPSSTVHPSRASQPSDQLSNVIKNPKKRTRASRRAPTTVLTTDTTNFRQMVQEFTGIPASPFSGSPYSRRPDIFSTLRPNNPHLDPLYPLRPSANKIFSSSLLNSTMIDSIVPTTNMITNNSNNNNTIGVASTSNNSNNYQQLPSDHLLNLQQLGGNARMNFSSLSGFQGHEVRNNDDDRWRSSGELTVRNGGGDNNDGVRENNLATFDGNLINSVSGESQHDHLNRSYNLNLSDKGMENVVTSSGSQGNLASWICPSE